MVPAQFRRRWQADRRSFTFDWVIPAEFDEQPIEVVLRNNAAVFELLGGEIEIGDGLEVVSSRAGSAVAVSLGRFNVTPVTTCYADVHIQVHIMGTLPLRELILSSPVYSQLLERLKGTLPGIFDLAGEPLYERKVRTDPGEIMVVRYTPVPMFLRFLASVPRVFKRPERRKTPQAPKRE